MQLEDAKVGMHLQDPKGNIWQILDIDKSCRIPCIHARCTNFVQPVVLCHSTLWIQKRKPM